MQIKCIVSYVNSLVHNVYFVLANLFANCASHLKVVFCMPAFCGLFAGCVSNFYPSNLIRERYVYSKIGIHLKTLHEGYKSQSVQMINISFLYNYLYKAKNLYVFNFESSASVHF